MSRKLNKKITAIALAVCLSTKCFGASAGNDAFSKKYVENNQTAILSEDPGLWFWVIDITKDLMMSYLGGMIATDTGDMLKLEQQNAEILKDLQEQKEMLQSLLGDVVVKQISIQNDDFVDTKSEFVAAIRTFGYQSQNYPFYNKFRQGHPAFNPRLVNERGLWMALSQYDRENQKDPAYNQGSLTMTFFDGSIRQLKSLEDLTTDTTTTMHIIGTSATNASQLPAINKSLDTIYNLGYWMLTYRAQIEVWRVWFGIPSGNLLSSDDEVSQIVFAYHQNLDQIYKEYQQNYNLAAANAAHGPYRVQYCNNTGNDAMSFQLKELGLTYSKNINNNQCYFSYPQNSDYGNFEMDADKERAWHNLRRFGCYTSHSWEAASGASFSANNPSQRFIGMKVTGCSYVDDSSCNYHHIQDSCHGEAFTVSAHDAGFDPIPESGPADITK
jgi:hypothetical protein